MKKFISGLVLLFVISQNQIFASLSDSTNVRLSPYSIRTINKICDDDGCDTIIAYDNHLEKVMRGETDIDELVYEDGTNILMKASFLGDIEVVERMLALGANPNIANKNDDSTALMAASYSGHIEVLKFLVTSKALVDQTKKNGTTALGLAAQIGSYDAVKFLLASGADVNHRSVHKNIPLHVAAKKGHIDVVRLLLENKALVNAQNIEGETPIMGAALEGHTDVMNLLIAFKADMTITTKRGLTVDDYISMRKKQRSVS